MEKLSGPTRPTFWKRETTKENENISNLPQVERENSISKQVVRKYFCNKVGGQPSPNLVKEKPSQGKSIVAEFMFRKETPKEKEGENLKEVNLVPVEIKKKVEIQEERNTEREYETFDKMSLEKTLERKHAFENFIPRKVEFKEDFRMSTDKKHLRAVKPDNFSFSNNGLSLWKMQNSFKGKASKKIFPKQAIPKISEILENMRKNDDDLSEINRKSNSRREQFEKTVGQLPVIEGLGAKNQVWKIDQKNEIPELDKKEKISEIIKRKEVSDFEMKKEISNIKMNEEKSNLNLKKEISDVKLEMQEPGLEKEKEIEMANDLVIKSIEMSSGQRNSEPLFLVPKNSTLKSARPVSIFGEDDMTNFSSKFTEERS